MAPIPARNTLVALSCDAVLSALSQFLHEIDLQNLALSCRTIHAAMTQLSGGRAIDKHFLKQRLHCSQLPVIKKQARLDREDEHNYRLCMGKRDADHIHACASCSVLLCETHRFHFVWGFRNCDGAERAMEYLRRDEHVVVDVARLRGIWDRRQEELRRMRLASEHVDVAEVGPWAHRALHPHWCEGSETFLKRSKVCHTFEDFLRERTFLHRHKVVSWEITLWVNLDSSHGLSARINSLAWQGFCTACDQTELRLYWRADASEEPCDCDLLDGFVQRRAMCESCASVELRRLLRRYSEWYAEPLDRGDNIAALPDSAIDDMMDGNGCTQIGAGRHTAAIGCIFCRTYWILSTDTPQVRSKFQQKLEDVQTRGRLRRSSDGDAVESL